MSGTSFRIDLDEVEAAAKAIRAMLDDLEAPAARLEAVIKQIKPTAYGTEAVGRSLTGGSSSVGGLPEHQEQVFAGVRAYLQNSAQMAANLELMVQRYRETEEAQTAELSRLNGGRGGDGPGAVATPVTVTAPLTAVDGTRVSPVSTPLTAVDGTRVSQVSAPLTAVDGTPAAPLVEETRPTVQVQPVSAPVTLPPVHTPEPAFHNPDAPDLAYNERNTDPDREPRPMPGGGRNQLI
ncbi:hypothetical protein [Kitasatospora sp. NPDC059571]|uniref:hypothetical protein n=1 Tax=Kitasatospora sp. NPDC059571 TaxID=3346871 RepID=UPI0036A6CD8D